MGSLEIMEVPDLPEKPNSGVVYTLIPKNSDESYYWERVDRNIGWITREEQKILRSSTVGIAGCGGMGGLIAASLLRLGVGEIHIADCEEFDVSNINRQFAAGRKTIGLSKAFATAKMLRDITDDTKIVVYPQGIAEETVEHFLEGCDVVCDEIEFWAIAGRILLHERARDRGISLFNCNTVGFGTHLFLFTPSGKTMEECLGFSYEEALNLQERVQRREAGKEEIKLVMDKVLEGLVPSMPSYRKGKKDQERLRERLLSEGKASIIATNPPMATGFLSDWILLYLLWETKSFSVRRMPEYPSYLYLDAIRGAVTIGDKDASE